MPRNIESQPNSDDEKGENIEKPELKIENIEIEVSEKELAQLLSSENFLEALKIAGHKTAETGHEAGFTVYIYESGKFKITEIKEGGTDSMGAIIEGGEHFGTNEEVIGQIEEEDYNESFEEFLDLHFHPAADEAIIPSGADLKNLRSDSIEAICRINEDKSIDIMLVKLTKESDRDIISDIAESYKQEKNRKVSPRSSVTEEILVREILKNNGFDSYMVSYWYNEKKDKYNLSKKYKSEIKKMGNFKIKIQKFS